MGASAMTTSSHQESADGRQDSGDEEHVPVNVGHANVYGIQTV